MAALHRTTGPAYGLDHDNIIGANPQANRLTDDWVSFFQAHRLQAQLVLAELYNLYHLLNHLNLFGEGYGGSVDRILRRYVG